MKNDESKRMHISVNEHTDNSAHSLFPYAAAPQIYADLYHFLENLNVSIASIEISSCASPSAFDAFLFIANHFYHCRFYQIHNRSIVLTYLSTLEDEDMLVLDSPDTAFFDEKSWQDFDDLDVLSTCMCLS